MFKGVEVIMVLLYVIFFSISIPLIVCFILTVKKYDKREKEFVNYLFRNNDTYGLDAMGLLNNYS